MSGRRLPLHSRPATEAASGSPLLAALVDGTRTPVALPGRVIGVADTGTCELAMRWAARLAEALAERSLGAHVLLTSFDAELLVDSAARRLFSAARSVQSLALGAAHVAGAPAGMSVSGRDPWLVVGQPALLAYRARLSVLLNAGQPVLRWPDGMRALRGRTDLEVSGDGFALCGPLADCLAKSPAGVGR